MDALGLATGVDDADIQLPISIEIAEFKMGWCPWAREVQRLLHRSTSIIWIDLNGPGQAADNDFRCSIAVQISAGDRVRIVAAAMHFPDFK